MEFPLGPILANIFRKCHEANWFNKCLEEFKPTLNLLTYSPNMYPLTPEFNIHL